MDNARVTDPDLIRLLEAPEEPTGGLKRVTDPDLIRKLNAEEPAPEPPPREDGRAHNALNAAARGLVDGVPVLGPALLGGIDRADAALRALSNDTRYGDEVAKAKQYDADVAAEHPIAHGAGEVAGGIAGTAPMIAAAPAAFGAGAGGLLGRSAASLASGAILGGTDAAVRSGGDAKEAVKGTIAGGALGAIAPGAGQLVGEGISRAAAAIGARTAPTSGLGQPATRMLAEDVRNSGGVDAVRARMAELGPDSMLLDASPSLQGQAQGLAVRPETREAVVAPIASRAAGTTDRLAADVNGALGPSVSPAAAVADLKAQRAVPNDAIGAALDNAPGPVSARGILQIIDQKLSQARGAEEAVLRRARGMLAQEDPQTGWLTIADDPRVLHNVKQDLDGIIHYGAPDIGVQPGSQARKESAAQMVRSQLNSLLRSKVPGYADANDASAALARQIEAVGDGSTLLRSGEGATPPADLARRLAAMPPEERSAMAVGTRGAIDQAVGTQRNDLSAVQGLLQGEGGWNTANLAQLHGDAPVQRIVDATRREAAFDAADRNVARGAEAAQRQRAAERVAPRGSLGDDVAGTVAGAVGGIKGFALAQAGRAVKGAINAAGQAADVARNRELAQAVTQRQGTELDRLLAAIEARHTAELAAASVGRAAQIGTQAGVVSQADRARGYVPLPFALSTALR